MKGCRLLDLRKLEMVHSYLPVRLKNEERNFLIGTSIVAPNQLLVLVTMLLANKPERLLGLSTSILTR